MSATSTVQLSSSAYDKAKPIAQIWLPAIITLYSAIAAIWNLSFQVEIVASLGAVNVFLGAVLGLSSSNFKAEQARLPEAVPAVQGDVVAVQGEDGSNRISLRLNMPAEELLNQNFVTFEVKKEPEEPLA